VTLVVEQACLARDTCSTPDCIDLFISHIRMFRAVRLVQSLL
jgi:hypothetical protein